MNALSFSPLAADRAGITANAAAASHLVALTAFRICDLAVGDR